MGILFQIIIVMFQAFFLAIKITFQITIWVIHAIFEVIEHFDHHHKHKRHRRH